MSECQTNLIKTQRVIPSNLLLVELSRGFVKKIPCWIRVKGNADKYRKLNCFHPTSTPSDHNIASYIHKNNDPILSLTLRMNAKMIQFQFPSVPEGIQSGSFAFCKTFSYPLSRLDVSISCECYLSSFLFINKLIMDFFILFSFIMRIVEYILT